MQAASPIMEQTRFPGDASLVARGVKPGALARALNQATSAEIMSGRTEWDNGALPRAFQAAAPPPELPGFMKRLTEASEDVQSVLDGLEAQHRAFADDARILSDAKARERQEVMDILTRLAQAVEDQRRRAEFAEAALVRIADAAEQMRADVAEAREAQRRAEADTAAAQRESRRWRWLSPLIAVALSAAVNVALRLLGV
jgi:hypothetical protein